MLRNGAHHCATRVLPTRTTGALGPVLVLPPAGGAVGIRAWAFVPPVSANQCWVGEGPDRRNLFPGYQE